MIEEVFDYIENAVYFIENKDLFKDNYAKCATCYGCKTCRGPNCKIDEPIKESDLANLLKEL